MRLITSQNNFIYLTVALVVLLLTGALSLTIPMERGHNLLQFVTLITVVVGLRSLGVGQALSRLVLGLAGAIVVISLIGEFVKVAGLDYVYLLITLVFFAWAAWVTGRQVLFTGTINTNRIVGSLALYLLLGLIWSTLFLLLLEMSPTALNGVEDLKWNENFAITTYFSFVTLTTLGFGDISPAEPLAAVVVFLESVIGVFYIAIVVASLVSARLEQIRTENLYQQEKSE